MAKQCPPAAKESPKCVTSPDGVTSIGQQWTAQFVYTRSSKKKFRKTNVELFAIFDELVAIAKDYKTVTGRYLPLFGELGEIFAELAFGLKRHKPRAQGSDGRLGNDFIEVKTMTPENTKRCVTIESKGHFSKLVIVNVTAEFGFAARMWDRRSLFRKSQAKAKVSWQDTKP